MSTSLDGEGVGVDARGDVREGGLFTEGGRDGGMAVRSRVFGDDDLEHGGGLGSVVDGVGGAAAVARQTVPYLILDARYEKVREAGTVSARAMQIAVGIDETGRATRAGGETGDAGKRVVVDRVPAGVEGAWTAWRGVRGVGQSRRFEAGDRQGVDPGPLATLRCAFFAQRERQAATSNGSGLSGRLEAAVSVRGSDGGTCAALKVWVNRWGDVAGYRRLVDRVEENVEETFTVYRLPGGHRWRMKSTNMLERLNEEIRRRTRVVRIFPNEASCLRLIRAYVDSLLTRASKLSVQDGSSDQVQSYVRLLDAIMTCVVDREPVWFTCVGSISLSRARRHCARNRFCRWRLADSLSPTFSSVLPTHDRLVPHATSTPAQGWFRTVSG